MEEKRRILIVDDEEDLCDSIKQTLEATGNLEVTTCCDSRMAVRQVRKQPPDLILLEIMMPGMDGSGIAAELEADVDTRDIPIIFLTTLVSREHIERYGDRIGGRLFMAKPTETERLVDAIDTMTLQ